MKKEEFKPEKIKIKRNEFPLYCIDGLNYINGKLNTDRIIENHVKHSKLTNEEIEFFQEYETQTYNPKVVDDKHYKSLTMDEIREKMRVAVEEQMQEAEYREINRKLNLKPIGNQNKNKLHHKFNYLVHMLSSRCTANEDGYTNVSAELLKKVLGDEYNIALRTLVWMGVIGISGEYNVGQNSRAYYLRREYLSSIRVIPCNHRTIKKYIDKSKKELDKYKIAKFKKLSERDKFIVEKYNQSLSQLIMSRNNECEDYIYNKKIYETNKPYQKEYYKNTLRKYTIEKSGPFQIKEIDKNNRIYHILTNTGKDLKEYLNIKFSIDIKNSHPLLLNQLLLIYYINNELFNKIINQSNNKLFNINNILSYSKNYITRYVSHNINNELIYNNIDDLFKSIHKLPNDVKKYIEKTSKGLLWDELLEACETKGLEANSRSELKAQMFAEVFYSKTKIMAHKEHGKVFKEIYPNVLKIINLLKPKGDETKLSHLIMRLESELFYQILHRIYSETEYNTINIHDAIIVLDIPNNVNCTESEIESIMKEVYNEYGLFPSLSVEHYN